MRTAYVAEVLKDGHLSFPNDVRKKLHLHEGMRIKATLEDIVKKEAKEFRQKIAQLQHAATDGLFLEDLKQMAEDFGTIDLEGLEK